VIRIASILFAAVGFATLTGDQVQQYAADEPKTILELQQFRQTTSIHFKGPDGESAATLVNLNPAINAWYLLQIVSKQDTTSWHLENAHPAEARLTLDENGIVIVEGRSRYSCKVFGALSQARNSQVTYAPLCEGRLYLRNPSKGHRTALETATEFLRDQVWGGEKVIAMFHHLMADRYRETAEVGTQGPPATPIASSVEMPDTALLDPQYATRRITPYNMGIALDRGVTAMTPGAWYAAAANPGIYASVLQPSFIAPSVLQSYKTMVSNLDNVESASLVYAIAFDLDQYDLAYALGTMHPQVEWSERATGKMRDSRLPGPDGIGSISPLTSTGMIRPDLGRNTVAAFTGGFKRNHGAFRSGDLALRNHASHYGFIENGVVFSKLQPGLATVYVLDDGALNMKTWSETDNAILGRIRYARQNGVPLVELDPASHAIVPGRLVARWGPGNWSGSEDEKLRTIRAGLALVRTRNKTFLIYAVFSDATPSAMARVFQAYQCEYAMLLDMNALEHTYLAVYRRSPGELAVDHLIKGMSELDKSASNENVPRFLGFSDNRDFFYVTRRKEARR
jgi:hypothetical protein